MRLESASCTLAAIFQQATLCCAGGLQPFMNALLPPQGFSIIMGEQTIMPSILVTSQQRPYLVTQTTGVQIDAPAGLGSYHTTGMSVVQ